METFSALLTICAGNSPASCEFPAQRPVTRSFDVFFDLCLNKRLRKQSWGWWFETLSRPLWRHCNVRVKSACTKTHTKDTTPKQLRWRHMNIMTPKSPATPLFVQHFFMRALKKTSNLRVTWLCEGNPLVTGGFPSQRACNAENISISWRHQVANRVRYSQDALCWYPPFQVKLLSHECHENALVMGQHWYSRMFAVRQ